MNEAFSIIVPLEKSGDGMLTGIASATSIDKDEERMSNEALRMMVDDIKKVGVNLFGNHEHDWENTLGVINNATLLDNKVQVGITLDDPATNPKIPMLLNKLNRGIKLGLSVGGNVVGWRYEYDKELNKKIKVLDKVRIYEVSVVGIPSNSDSYLSIPAAISKSAKIPSASNPCPCCLFETNKGVCPLCLTKI
jgi:HK97 family phage prohead protease